MYKTGNLQFKRKTTGKLFSLQAKTKESLRNLSMVLRQIGKGKEHLNGLINYLCCMMILKNKKTKTKVIDFVAEPSEKVANIKESVERAKEAVQCDVKDGTSWCKHVFLIHCISRSRCYIRMILENFWIFPCHLQRITSYIPWQIYQFDNNPIYSMYTWRGRIPSSSVHLVDQKITDPLYKVVVDLQK